MRAEVLAAIAFLTRVPVRAPPREVTGAAAFGLVGCLVGIAGAAALLLVGERAPLAAGGLAVTALAFVSGAFHLDGLADTADALAAPSAEAARRARRDPRVGAAGATAIAVTVLVDASLLASIVASAGRLTAALACLIAAAGSRAVAPTAAWLVGRPRREPGQASGLGRWFVDRVTARAAVVAPAVAVILAGVGSAFLARPALVVGLIGGVLLAVGAAAWLRRVRGDLDGDGFGFVIEIAFAAILLVTVVAL